MNEPTFPEEGSTRSSLADMFWLGIAFVLHLLYFAAFQVERACWRDEAHAWNLAIAPLRDFLPFFAYVEHQTGYLLALRAVSWISATPLAAGVFSLLCTIAAGGVLAKLSRNLKLKPTLGLTAWTLTLLAPLLYRYTSCVIRPYAFAFLLHACVLLGTTSLFSRYSVKRLLLLFPLIVLSVNTQPINLVGAYAVAGIWGLATLIQWFKMEQPTPLKALSSKLIGLPTVVVLSSIPMVIQSLRFADKMKGVEPHVSSDALSLLVLAKFLATTIKNTTGPLSTAVDYALCFDPGASLSRMLHHPAAGILFLAVTFMVLLLCRKPIMRSRQIEVLTLLALLFLLTGTGLWIASIYHVRMIEEIRSFSAMAPMAILMFAWVLDQNRVLRHLVLALMLINAIAGLPAFSVHQPGRLTDAKDAANFIESHEQAGDVILLANAQIGPSFSLYYQGAAPQTHHPYSSEVRFWDMVDLGRVADAQTSQDKTHALLEQAIHDGHRVWFVLSGSPAPEPTRYWYSPASLNGMESLLASRFNLITNLQPRSRIEPVEVRLYDPMVQATEPLGQPAPPEPPASE